MDDDQIALVRQLCTQAGMIMEDASAATILVGNLDVAGLGSVVDQARQDLKRALALTDAAGAMMRLSQLS